MGTLRTISLAFPNKKEYLYFLKPHFGHRALILQIVSTER